MKKILTILIVAVVIVGGYFLLDEKQEPQTNGSIKVGVIAPLTGNFAIFGERIRNAMEMVKEDIGQPAENIEIIYEDVCQPNQAVSATQKLIQVNKISWMGGSFCLVGLIPVIPIVEENDLFIFNIAANPDSTLNQSSVFSTNKSITSDSEQLADFAVSKLKAKTVATLYYITPLGTDYGKYFEQYFEEAGGQVLSSQQVQLEQSDFRTELAKIKSTNPDVIFVVHLAKSLGTFIKQGRELGIKSKILSHSEAEDPNVLITAGTASEGFYISSSEPKDKSKKVLDFEKRYLAKYGSAPDVIAANAYDSFYIQVDAYKKCGNSIECMKDYFYSVKNYDGVSGNLSMNSDGSTTKPVLFKVVRNGQFVRFEE